MVSVSWQQAAVVAGLVGLVAWTARLVLQRGRVVADALMECAILFALYAVWQLFLDFTVTSTTGAVSHGRWVWRVERTLRLPSERAVQRSILSYRWLVTFCNHYYPLAHYTGLLVCLAWVFFFHRSMYQWSRRTLALTTALLTIPFQSIPVAPPRLLPELGLVDTTHTSLSPKAVLAGLHDPGQLTAMPSAHVAWAVLVAVIIISISSRPWRWLAVAYPALTMMVVVWTGNHFWADGIVGGAIVVIVALVDRLVRQQRHGTSTKELTPVPA